MSVGGKVIEVIVLTDRVWIATRDRTHPNDRPTAIYVEPDARAKCIEVGDSIWWQGHYAMWTPKAGGKSDIKLKRIGGSGATRPDVSKLIESKKQFP